MGHLLVGGCTDDRSPATDTTTGGGEDGEEASQADAGDGDGDGGGDGDGDGDSATNSQDQQSSGEDEGDPSDSESQSEGDSEGDEASDDDSVRPACNIDITEIAVYQAVKTSIVEAGMAVDERAIEVIAGRDAYIRAFVEPSATGSTPELTATLTMTHAGGTTTYEDAKSINAASSDGDKASTFNFRVPAAELTDDAQYAVALTQTSSCEGATTGSRFPIEGLQDLKAKVTGAIYVMLVPVKSTTNGGDPNTSQELQDAFAEDMMSIYPTTEVIVTMHDEMVTDIDIGKGFETWGDVLDQVRQLQTDDRESGMVEKNVHYYGLLAPEGSGGAGGVAGGGWNGGGAGVGLGTKPRHAGIFSHEAGHMHGRRHAPGCNAGGPDDGYPNDTGRIEAWGLDLRNEELKDPNTEIFDFLSYCRPTWISAYMYGLITDKVAELADPQPEPQPWTLWRSIVVTPSGAMKWGHERGHGFGPRGRPEPAQLHHQGRSTREITVYRTDLSDSGGAIIEMPISGLRADWDAVRLRQSHRALQRDDTASIPALRRR